jgi:ABC-type transport system involved in Fe-S cluster assembly fused permease/ATPase subunit
VVASFFAWSIVLISLIDTTPSPTSAHLVTWLVALPLELIIIGTSLAMYTVPHHEPKVGNPVGGNPRSDITGWEILETIVYFCRLALLLGLSVIYLGFKIASRYGNRTAPGTPASDEQAPLLSGANHANGNPNGQAYGSSPSNKSGEAKEQPDAWAKPTETPSVNWYQYLKGYMVLVPYLWPAKSRRLQLLALTCFAIMIAQRAINVFVPILTANITDALTGKDGEPVTTPWALISVYILCRWLQGGQGLLGAARAILWVPVEQYAYRAISNAAFVHVHNLSAEFHTGKRTGEVISALNKGSAINSFLSYITFSVGPMIFDLAVAVVYLSINFDVYLGLTVAIVTFLYIYVTVRLAQWRVALRRNTVNSERDMEAVKNDSLHSWDTVKYFNAEEYEFERYRASILKLQGYQYWLEITLSIMNTSQGALFMLALLIACFIEAYQVAQGYQSVGKFVLLVVYMSQLQQPLNFFGTFYRAIQQSLINAERLLELFKEQPTVVDRPDVRELTNCTGDVVFDNVTFGYDKRKPALNSLSFRCQPGTTTALVGESGGGKTTIFRMLFRYYNPDAGRILIDGHDVQEVSIDSVRRNIGVVPQDCNMFNESVMYNLKYANQSATDEEVFAACRAAAIHDRIIAFPDGYETRVGERGVRLSGGERQRVAIARTILKNPRITLLDEATAALDTETEERIKSAFDSLSSGRTTIIIAHRLSTVVDADQILVLSGGTIVESGTHGELLQLEGRYARMWRKQSRAQQAQEEAEELRKQAKKVLENAEADSASVSEDEIERVKGRRGQRRGASERKVNFGGRVAQGSGLGPNAGNGNGGGGGGGGGGVESRDHGHGHGHGHPH